MALSPSKQEQIESIAKEFGYTLVFRKPENCLLRFERDGLRIDVWWTTLTVGVMEPGKEAWYHRRLSWDNLIEAIANPLKK